MDLDSCDIDDTFDLGFMIQIFEERYLGFDLWNAINGLIRIQIFKRTVLGLVVPVSGVRHFI